MPTTYEEVRERLGREPLPTSLAESHVDAVMEELGYTRRQGKGSHVNYRKAGKPTQTFAIHRRRVGPAAVTRLAALIQAEGR